MKVRLRSYQKSTFDDLQGSVDELFSSVPRANFLRPGSKILTFGSCFAANIATHLRGLGFFAKSVEVVEWLNTPLANLAFVKKCLGIGQFDLEYDETKFDVAGLNDLKELLLNADVIIITVGVGFDWVRRADGARVIKPDLYKLNDFSTRYVSPADQAKTIRELLEVIRSVNPKAACFLTLSPVPLEFSLTFPSAVESDCVSKSLLRAAIFECQQLGVPFVYWPAFEFFRWYSGHYARSFYGADGKVRHVDQDLIELIMRKFVQVNTSADSLMP